MTGETNRPRILVIGTGDTKSEELEFMAASIRAAGGEALQMDVSILGDPPYRPHYSKHDVLAAGGHTLEQATEGGDEMSAMTMMAGGAAILARRLHDAGEIDGMLALGGSMGTDLALDVALALPLGVPKFVVSTISYSHLLPPDRIATDLMMILWAGGLYGLNSVCRAVLSQASGAVVGAARTAVRPSRSRPVVGMSSLGKSCLKYMTWLKPELDRRGYELVVFHTTGMGGRALEAVAAQRGFDVVMDFSLQELANLENGSVVNSGPDRLENAGRAGIPQIVAPGAIDMIDVCAWQLLPAHLADRAYHGHNRLIGSIIATPVERRQIARRIGEKLSSAKGPVAFILPEGGIQEWDQPGQPFHDPQALSGFVEAMRAAIRPPVELIATSHHINSPGFAEVALSVLDRWAAEGKIPAGVTAKAGEAA
jgi:uncharacterized protein (UPF0261 family)